MAKAKEQKKGGPLAYLKDISAFIRDVLLTIVLVVCIVYPATIKYFLKESGLSKLSAFGVSVETKEVKEDVAQAQKEVTAKVVPATPLTAGEVPPEATNKPVDPKFKEAILRAERLAPQVLPSSGWVFLGTVNREKNAWVDGTGRTVAASWPVKPNDILTVRDDVYVRAITEGKYHSSAPVTSVAKVGDKLLVVEIDYSPAKSGSFFVWAKVAINPS